MKKRHRILFVIAAFAVLAGMIYVVIATNNIDLINSILPEKIAVFENVHMTGNYSSSESWEVKAREAWTSRDKFTTTLEHVTNAVITRNGRPMVTSLTARRMRIEKNKNVEVMKTVQDDPQRLPERQYRPERRLFEEQER